LWSLSGLPSLVQNTVPEDLAPLAVHSCLAIAGVKRKGPHTIRRLDVLLEASIKLPTDMQARFPTELHVSPVKAHRLTDPQAGRREKRAQQPLALRQCLEHTSQIAERERVGSPGRDCG
jgi:hypothetical protein